MSRPARIALSLFLLVAAAACTSQSDGDRFTYIVRYSVSGTIAAPMDITYTDASGAPVTVNGISAPWAIELPSMNYDYDALFTPSMRVFNTSLADGESFTPAISWKDYAVDFEARVLADRPTSNASGSPVAQDIALDAPPLPL